MHDNTYTIKDFYFWKIVFSLSLASFFIFASLYAVHPLMAIFIQEFHITVSTSSLSLSITVIGLIIGLIVHGFISDRVGRTIFIKLSLLGSIIPFIIIPLLDSFTLLLIFRFIQGLVFAGFLAAALAYIGEEINPKNLGLATALYIGSNASGGMTGRFVTGYLVEQNSWQMTFYLWASIGIVILFLVLLLLPKSHFFKPIHTPIKKDLQAYFHHLKNPMLVMLFVLGVILQLSFTGVWTYFPFHMQGEPFYLPIQLISFFYLAYGLGVVGSSIGGVLIARFNLHTVKTIGIIIMSIGIVLTLGKSIFLVIIGLCLACLGFFTAHSLTATSVNMIATHHKGSASSLYLASYYLGVSMGSTVFAPIWGRFGWVGIIIIASILPVVYMVVGHGIMRKEARFQG